MGKRTSTPSEPAKTAANDPLDSDQEFHLRLFSRHFQCLLSDLAAVINTLPADLTTPGAAESALATLKGIHDACHSSRRQLSSVQTLLRMPRVTPTGSSGQSTGSRRRPSQ
jgi:hypothetical protein